MANCFLRRTLTSPFFGAISNSPNVLIASMSRSWIGLMCAFGLW
jgi:hypothetical protein